ncbi:MAG: hypothetical protein O7C98_00875 [Planctomycetota bacterium]|nr:hypothetical protein [Planctomycetota bacterium]
MNRAGKLSAAGTLLLTVTALVWAADRDAAAMAKMAAPGEGAYTESILAAPQGVDDEKDLKWVARVRYRFKQPRVRAIVHEDGRKNPRAVIYDGKQAWLVTPVGATAFKGISASVRERMQLWLYPLGSSADGVKLDGNGRVASFTVQGLQGTCSYDSGGALHKIEMRNADGKLVLVRRRDGVVQQAVQDSIFETRKTRGGRSLDKALAQSLTRDRADGPVVTATAGARGVDEEAGGGDGKLDYAAVGAMERFRVPASSVEQFLRRGALGPYQEER